MKTRDDRIKVDFDQETIVLLNAQVNDSKNYKLQIFKGIVKSYDISVNVTEPRDIVPPPEADQSHVAVSIAVPLVIAVIVIAGLIYWKRDLIRACVSAL